MKIFCRLLVVTLACGTQQLAAEEYDRLVQAFVGALELDDQRGNPLIEGEQPVDIEFPTLPALGVEGEYRYGGSYVNWGLNPGVSAAWKSSDTRIYGSVGGGSGANIRIEVDNSLFLGELHLGGYLRARLGQAVTVYAAAGPMILYGRMKVEDQRAADELEDSDIELESSSESDFGFGLYGRAGIDFEIRGEQNIGLGLRYMKSELDLKDSVGKIDVEGPQVILSYTVPL